jgi:hypothetical protein
MQTNFSLLREMLENAQAISRLESRRLRLSAMPQIWPVPTLVSKADDEIEHHQRALLAAVRQVVNGSTVLVSPPTQP